MTEPSPQPKVHLRKVPYKEKHFSMEIERDKDGSPNDLGFNGIHGRIHHDDKHVGHFILKDNGQTEVHFQTHHKKATAKVSGAGRSSGQKDIPYVSNPHPHAQQQWNAHKKHHEQQDHQAIHHFLSDKDKNALVLRHKALELQAKNSQQAKNDDKGSSKFKDDDLDSYLPLKKSHLKEQLLHKMIQLASKR